MPSILTSLGVRQADHANMFPFRRPEMKSRTAFSCSPEVRQEWRGKAGHVPATKRTVVKTEKFHKNIDYHEKNRSDMAAMQMLHCTIFIIYLY